jgi:hypothetical protein
MKPYTLFFLLLIISCNKGDNSLKETPAAKMISSVDNPVIISESPLTSCIVTYWTAVQEGGYGATTAFQDLLACHGSPELSLGGPRTTFSYKTKICYRCMVIRHCAASTFPYLLEYLGLSDSSTQAEIAAVHDSLQQFNIIIRAAIEDPNWSVGVKQDAVMMYYHDVYLAANPPLSDDELNFLIQYTALLFLDDMVVLPGWAYNLYYPGDTPPLYMLGPKGFIPDSIPADPVTGWPLGTTTWDDGFLEAIGVQVAIRPPASCPLTPVSYYAYD